MDVRIGGTLPGLPGAGVGVAESKSVERSKPLLLSLDGKDVSKKVRITPKDNPIEGATLGDVGVAVEVRGPERFPEAVLVMPIDRAQLAGIEPQTLRLFRVDRKSEVAKPVWQSGFNEGLGYAWGIIRRPGTYVPIGLPADALLTEAIRSAAEQRRLADVDDQEGDQRVTQDAFATLVEASADDIGELRSLLTTLEVKTRAGGVAKDALRFREGGHLLGLALPHDEDWDSLRRRISALRTPPGGLPEEQLFFPPDQPRDGEPPWFPNPGSSWHVDEAFLSHLHLPLRIDLCWILRRNWWMYHANERHTGAAAGCSDITSTSVGRMVLESDVPVDGTVVSIPSIVADKIYVGTGGYGANAGTLYKIDLGTGTVEGRFPTVGAAYYSYDGIGGSPAVRNGRVYFSAVHGKVYCVDADSMTASPPHPPAIWVVDLKNADPAHNQPVANPLADCWSSPLVVNDRVYVAAGEGETNSFSFIYCLDANTGTVLWLFCTNQFTPGVENSPNVLPTSTVGLSPLPAMFSSAPDPAAPGSAPWSSCAYDATLDRIYIGTGNARPDNPLPDPRYASGIISLDATTGDFKAFFQPATADSYRPGDLDVDVPAAPMIFSRGSERVVCIGSKNGSFFLLDPNTLQVLGGGAQRRQLLPRNATTGAALPTVDPIGAQGENKWGVMGTAAVHAASGRLFVGLGGYSGIDDYRVTPFVRALEWDTLSDAWPTAVDTIDGNPVARYSAARPPLYTTPYEAGLSSPAVVNDVVFVSTSKTGLYALRVDNGLCLWSAPGMPAGGWPDYCLGPAIYGNYVVVGAASKVLIYHLPSRRSWIPPIYELPPYWWRIRWPWPPPPPPDPWGPRAMPDRAPQLEVQRG